MFMYFFALHCVFCVFLNCVSASHVRRVCFMLCCDVLWCVCVSVVCCVLVLCMFCFVPCVCIMLCCVVLIKYILVV